MTLEHDALASAALTPAIERLRNQIDDSVRYICPTVTIRIGFARDLADIMEKARDALEAQDELLSALINCCGALFESGISGSDGRSAAAYVQGTNAIARATGGKI